MTTAAAPIRIATRGSALALWQAEHVRGGLADGGDPAELVVLRTTGDDVQNIPLSWIGDRGLFTREIDDALLRGDADVAVHSLKDLPTRIPDGLVLAAVTLRADPRDVIIARDPAHGDLASLPAGARLGTSSLRRRAQLLAARPDVDAVDVRGNLNTRLAKLDSGEYDALLLAAAGVLRLGWHDRISGWLDAPAWLPAVGQGALGVVTREGEGERWSGLRALHDHATATAVGAERAFLRAVEGGCQVPVGAYARADGDEIVLDALVASVDGTRVLRGQRRFAPALAEAAAIELAEQLLTAGGREILDGIRPPAAPDAP